VFDKNTPIIEKEGMKLILYHPSWFHHALFMDCYILGDYEKAYTQVQRFILLIRGAELSFLY
jgi:hypothetical protein